MAVLLLLPGVTIAGILSFDFFLPLRQALAGQILSGQLNRPTTVKGAVSIHFGPKVTVLMEDAVVYRPVKDTGLRRLFERVQFESPYRLFMGDVSKVTDFEMTGADIDVSDATSNDRSGNWSYYHLVSETIKMPAFDTLRLSDVTVRYSNQEDGWNEALHIKDLAIVPSAGGDRLDMKLDAIFNGTPLSSVGTLSRPSDRGVLNDGRFELVTNFPAMETRLSGTLDTSNPIADVEGQAVWTSPSLSKVMAAAGITSELDGTVDASWRYKGALDALKISGIDMEFRSLIGDRLFITGSAGNTHDGPVIDLAFEASLAPIEMPEDVLAIEVREISGKLQGPLTALSVDEAQIVTNTANVDISTIGPITVGRVVKDEDGRVGLQDLVIRDGPVEDPYLNLKGHFDDVIGLSGLELSGGFRFPVSHLLDTTVSPKPDLGVLEGDIAVSDTEEGLSLDAFSGSARATDLFDLSFDLVVPELRLVDQLSFSTDLEIPDPTALLEAAGVGTDRALPPISFAGQSSLASGELRFAGDLLSGKSQIDADLVLALKPDTNAWHLGGDIASERLELSEITGLADFAELGLAGPEDTISVADDVASDFVADVNVAAQSLISGKKTAGSVSAMLLYENKIIKAAGLSLVYLGGLVNGDFGLDFKKTAPRAFAKGRIEKFPFKKLMAELGVKVPISSTVYASLDLTATMGTAADLLRSMSGKLTASLWGGYLPDRMIELSGLSAFTWLVSGTSDSRAKLVCAKLPLQFKSGRAASRSLVVETANVQIVGGGNVDLRAGTLDLAFVPRAKKKQLVQIVSPFELKGQIAAPELIVKEAGAGRAVGEVLSLPLNLLGHVFQGSGAVDESARPCVIPKNTRPK